MNYHVHKVKNTENNTAITSIGSNNVGQDTV